MNCTTQTIARLLRYRTLPPELLMVLEPFRVGDRYRAEPEMREILCGLLEERAGSRNRDVRNGLQNWRQLCRLVRSGEAFRGEMAV